MKEIIGIIMFTICVLYGIRQGQLRRTPFKIDYWVMCAGIILCIIL